MAENKTIIKVENLVKQYDDSQAPILKGINQEIKKGDVVVVIGGSGCGKSTFLRCLNLLEKPTSGKIFIDGEELTAPNADINAIRKKMGMVYQSFNLFSHLTVLENVIKTPMLLNHVPKEQAIKEAMEYLQLVGMQERADHMPSQLSGGQQQRAAIARCIAMKPEIILFDEPTSALDPTMVDEVLSVIRNLAKQGMTCVIVTHEMNFAKNIATKIIYIADGVICEEGTPSEIFDHPKKEQTKAFVNKLKVFEYSKPFESFDMPEMQTGLKNYCIRYAISSSTTKRMGLIIEEILNCYKARSTSEKVTVEVHYGENSKEVDIIFRDQCASCNILKAPEMDEIGGMLIEKMVIKQDWRYEDDENILVLTIKDE